MPDVQNLIDRKVDVCQGLMKKPLNIDVTDGSNPIPMRAAEHEPNAHHSLEIPPKRWKDLVAKK